MTQTKLEETIENIEKSLATESSKLNILEANTMESFSKCVYTLERLNEMQEHEERKILKGPMFTAEQIEIIRRDIDHKLSYSWPKRGGDFDARILNLIHILMKICPEVDQKYITWYELKTSPNPAEEKIND